MSAEFEAQILADLRRTHAQLKTGDRANNGNAAWSMRLTIEEVDLLLKIVDERDDLKRRLLSDWEPEIHPVRAKSPLIAQADLPLSERISVELAQSQRRTFDGREARETPPRRPEIDEPGCCETCRGSGKIGVGPWGARPPKTTCTACAGTGWSNPA